MRFGRGALVIVAVLLTGCLPEPAAAPASVPARAPAAPSPEGVADPLLRAAPGGDGDSWRDTRGREYRLGLVNTPELGECFGQAASAHRKQLTQAGFRARPYARDRYGRQVSVVTLADGRNLNVLLARTGFANDRYLTRYRSENPVLAGQLDVAFAAARAEERGVWGRACSPTRHVASRDVLTGHAVAALDCGDISFRRLEVLAPDPHHLDRNHDGIGCETG